jgi:hypothetical protein
MPDRSVLTGGGRRLCRQCEAPSALALLPGVIAPEVTQTMRAVAADYACGGRKVSMRNRSGGCH